MNAVNDPMILQFWLWGLDALRGDFSARGFQKSARPTGSTSSVYHLNGLHLHGFGLWLEGATGEDVLVYRRPRMSWYCLPHNSQLNIERFASNDASWCESVPARRVPHHTALAAIRFHTLEHEHWIATRHGPSMRRSQLENIPSPAVRRTRTAWHQWVGNAVYSTT